MVRTGKPITINNCYEFKTGTHKIELPDKQRVRLKIEETDTAPLCTLTFRDRNEDNRLVKHRWVDRRGDGQFIVKYSEYRAKGGRLQKEKRVEPASPRYMTIEPITKYDPLMLRAMRQVTMLFAYKPCIKIVEPVQRAPARGLTMKWYGKRSVRYPEIHFDTAKSVIRPDAKGALDNFVAKHHGGAILIEGHCDYRGGDQYNYRLGKTRARATKNYLRRAFKAAGKPIPEMAVMSLGEAKPTGKSLESDRRVVIFPGRKGQSAARRVITKRALNISRTPVYLIDASASMTDVWDVVLTHNFPRGAKKYSFSGSKGVIEGIPHSAQGGTPLWSSLSYVLGNMPNGKSLTLISDGGDTGDSFGLGGYGRDRSNGLTNNIKFANSRGIKINVVYIGERDEAHVANMRRLARKTGGRFYLRTY